MEEVAAPARLEEVAPVPLVVTAVVLAPLEVIQLPAPLVMAFDACIAQGGRARCYEGVPQLCGRGVQACEEVLVGVVAVVVSGVLMIFK